MQKFGDRLYILRKEAGMTQEDLATAIHERNPEAKLSKPMISRYEKNIHFPQRYDLVQDIADLFCVTVGYLMGKTDERYEITETINALKKIPILNKIVIGVPILAQENLVSYEYISKSINVDFGLRVNDDSMINARIFNGDIVYIRQQIDVENGEIALVHIGSEDASLKRIYKNGTTVILHFENPCYTDLVFNRKDIKEFSILGKAVKQVSDIR